MLASTATVSVRRGPRCHEESRRWPFRRRTRAARVSPSARPRSPATWLPAQTRNQPWQYAPICHDTPVATGISDFNQNLVPLVEPHPSVNQTSDPVSLVPLQPQIDRRSRHTRQRGNLFLPPPLSPPHHDSRPRRHGCRRVRAVRQRSQLFPVIRFQLHTIIKHEIRCYVKLIESRDTRGLGQRVSDCTTSSQDCRSVTQL